MSEPSQASPTHRAYGDVLLHPLSLLCIALWAINDHYGKGAWPSAISGKLSDVVCLIGLSLLTGATAELLCGLFGVSLTRARQLGARASVWGAVIGAVVMMGINLWPSWAEAYEVGLGAAQWSAVSVWHWLTDQPITPRYRVSLTMDPTDLYTIPAAYLGPALYRHAQR